MLKFYESAGFGGRKKSGVRHIGMRLYITSIVEKETCGIEAANAYGVLLVMEWTATT